MIKGLKEVACVFKEALTQLPGKFKVRHKFLIANPWAYPE
jgi:hypothetical protein